MTNKLTTFPETYLAMDPNIISIRSLPIEIPDFQPSKTTMVNLFAEATDQLLLWMDQTTRCDMTPQDLICRLRESLMIFWHRVDGVYRGCAATVNVCLKDDIIHIGIHPWGGVQDFLKSQEPTLHAAFRHDNGYGLWTLAIPIADCNDVESLSIRHPRPATWMTKNRFKTPTLILKAWCQNETEPAQIVQAWKDLLNQVLAYYKLPRDAITVEVEPPKAQLTLAMTREQLERIVHEEPFLWTTLTDMMLSIQYRNPV